MQYVLSKVWNTACNLLKFDNYQNVWNVNLVFITGNSFSEALILASTNPQYDKRLFIKLWDQYMKIPSSEHVVYTKLFWMSKQKQTTICVHNMELRIFMYWTRNSMNNLSSYCGLVDAKIRASDKDLPLRLQNFCFSNQLTALKVWDFNS